MRITTKFKLGMSPQDCDEILLSHEWSKFRDGTVAGAWGDIKSGFEDDIEDEALALGLSLPYGNQVWMKGDDSIVLHFSGREVESAYIPILFWVEYKDAKDRNFKEDSKSSDIGLLPAI